MSSRLIGLSLKGSQCSLEYPLITSHVEQRAHLLAHVDPACCILDQSIDRGSNLSVSELCGHPKIYADPKLSQLLCADILALSRPQPQ